jgi:hypothetical protein
MTINKLAIAIALPMTIGISQQGSAASVPAGSIAIKAAAEATSKEVQYRPRTARRYYNYVPQDRQLHDPYYGTPFENVAPYSGPNPWNPYRGTRWYGVVPY